MIRFVLQQSIKSLGASYKHEIELSCKFRMGSFNLEVETLFVNRVCICMLSIAIRIVVRSAHPQGTADACVPGLPGGMANAVRKNPVWPFESERVSVKVGVPP